MEKILEVFSPGGLASLPRKQGGDPGILPSIPLSQSVLGESPWDSVLLSHIPLLSGQGSHSLRRTLFGARTSQVPGPEGMRWKSLPYCPPHTSTPQRM